MSLGWHSAAEDASDTGKLPLQSRQLNLPRSTLPHLARQQIHDFDSRAHKRGPVPGAGVAEIRAALSARLPIGRARVCAR